MSIARNTKMHLHIGVLASGADSQFACVGLGGEKNLYVDADGKWLGRYVPGAMRGTHR